MLILKVQCNRFPWLCWWPAACFAEHVEQLIDAPEDLCRPFLLISRRKAQTTQNRMDSLFRSSIAWRERDRKLTAEAIDRWSSTHHAAQSEETWDSNRWEASEAARNG